MRAAANAFFQDLFVLCGMPRPPPGLAVPPLGVAPWQGRVRTGDVCAFRRRKGLFMATLDGKEDAGLLSARTPIVELARLRWPQILAISIFYLALNFHWATLGLIVLPSQVFKIVGELHKGEALAFVLVPGAFVSLFANP